MEGYIQIAFFLFLEMGRLPYGKDEWGRCRSGGVREHGKDVQGTTRDSESVEWCVEPSLETLEIQVFMKKGTIWSAFFSYSIVDSSIASTLAGNNPRLLVELKDRLVEEAGLQKA